MPDIQYISLHLRIIVSNFVKTNNFRWNLQNSELSKKINICTPIVAV